MQPSGACTASFGSLCSRRRAPAKPIICGIASATRSDDDVNRQIYIPFSTMGGIKDTEYLDGIWFSYTGDNELAEKSLRETLAAAHHFNASDHNAVYVANLMTELHQFKILSLALQVLLSLVGAFTLGIAGVGLMNIMLVAVQQRTREIGVEKALGADRKSARLNSS